MCGICGVFGRPEVETVKRMLKAIAHRGPDDEHFVSGTDFVLGARRLSILDLAGGRQPISNECGDICAAQNGELYNYPEIRQYLLNRNHELHTTCDTEILPHLYEEFGQELPKHIDGMFAVGVWDRNNHCGLLARDRTGKKPLFYCQVDRALYFASEIKALLEIPGFERILNWESLHHFLSLKHIPAPQSIFRTIRCLPPGHYLFYRNDGQFDIFPYWSIDYSPDSSIFEQSEEEITEHLERLIRCAVKKRLLSDVPIGFFLSGGIDSSLTTALAAEQSVGRIMTFTLTYAHESSTPAKETDRKWARWVAEKYGTEHFEEQIEFTDLPGTLRKIIQCFDEPFSGVISTYFLARLIAQHVKTSISGDGADEIFGSYLSHRLAIPLSLLPEYRQTKDATLLCPFDDRIDYLMQLEEPEDWAWRAKLLVMTESEKRSLFSPDTAAHLNGTSTADWIRGAFGSLTATDPLNRILEAEFRTVFPDQVLTFTDRLSMAHSLEVRTPFLDTKLLEYVSKIPGHIKFKNNTPKYLLRKVSERFFPHEMVHRPKEGFLMPITQWILNDLKEYVCDTLSESNLNRHGIFSAPRVRELVERLYNGPVEYQRVNQVFSLLVFQEWYDIYKPSL